MTILCITAFWIGTYFTTLNQAQVAISSATLTTTFAVIGDYGLSGPNEANVAGLVHDLLPDFIIAAGDNNYPHGDFNTLDDNIGAYYHDYILFDTNSKTRYRQQGSPIQRFFPVLGNHDWDSRNKANPLLNYLVLPGNERTYQIDQGPIAFFMLDSDHREPTGISATSAQAKWLQQALSQTTAPWKIVVLHHAPYSRGKHGDSKILQWPYQAWGASMVLAGHDHHYERTVIHTLPYVVVGTGGAELRPATRPVPQQATFNTVHDMVYGALLVRATPKVLTALFYDTNRNLLDSFIMNHP